MGRWDRAAVQLRVESARRSGAFSYADAYLTEWRDPHTGEWIPTPNMSLGLLAGLKLDGSPIGPQALRQSQGKVLASLKANDLGGAQDEVQKILTGLGEYEPSDPDVGTKFDSDLAALNTFMGVTNLSQLQAEPEDDGGFGDFDDPASPVGGSTAPVKGALDPANGYDIAMDNLPGVTFDPKWAANDSVIDLKEDPTLWSDVPVTRLDVGPGSKLIATEEAVKSKHVDPIVNGSTPLRSGYFPKILRTDEGDVIIDGNTRVAMYKGLGTTSVDAQVIDVRRDQTEWYATQPDSPPLEVSKTTYERSLADEKVLSAKMQLLAKQHGAALKGWLFRIKQPPSLTRKIGNDVAAAQKDDNIEDLTPAEAAANIKDSLRYTMQLEDADFVEQTQQVIANLKAAGYTNIRLKNPMAAPAGTVAYRDTKITAVPPGGSLPFELQFHTPASLAVKAKIHPIYEKQRALEDGPADPQYQELYNQMVALTDTIPVPPGVETITV